MHFSTKNAHLLNYLKGKNSLERDDMKNFIQALVSQI
jgi:hypothetical protein